METRIRRTRKLTVLAVAILTVLAVGATMLLPAEASAASKVKKPAQVKSLTLKAKSTTSVAVKFKKVTGAKGYKVYRATSANGKYKLVKTLKGVKKVSYTDTKLRADTRYYYKVRAYKTYKSRNKTKMLYGKYSARKSVWTNYVKPSAPGKVATIKAQRNIDTRTITITFSGVDDADGYVIYEKCKEKWDAITTIEGNKVTSHERAVEYPDVTYFFKVRAYKTYTQHGKTKYVYGPYSNIDSASITSFDWDFPDRPKVTEEEMRQEIDTEQISNDMEAVDKTGEAIDKSVITGTLDENSKPYVDFYYIQSSDSAAIGYIYKWAKECTIVNGAATGPWYGANFSLMLKSDECTAYYTTDGSIPSPTNGTKVTKDMGRIKIRGDHSTAGRNNFGDYCEALTVKVHYYANGKLVALDYYKNNEVACYHSYPEGNGLTLNGNNVIADGWDNYGTLEEHVATQKVMNPEDWYEFLPENNTLMAIKKQYPGSWWEHLPEDWRNLYQ